MFNVPIIAVRTLNLHEGDALRVSITDNAIRIEKDPTSGDLPARLALPAGV